MSQEITPKSFHQSPRCMREFTCGFVPDLRALDEAIEVFEQSTEADPIRPRHVVAYLQAIRARYSSSPGPTPTADLPTTNGGT